MLTLPLLKNGHHELSNGVFYISLNLHLLNFICFLSVKWSFIPDTSRYHILSMRKCSTWDSEAGGPQESIASKPRNQGSVAVKPSELAVTGLLSYCTSRASTFFKSNIKAGCQLAHMLPIASSAFWNSRASVKPRSAFFQLNSWGKKYLKFLFASSCLPTMKLPTNALWQKVSYFFLMQYLKKKSVP